MSDTREPGVTFACFGSECSVHVGGDSAERTAQAALVEARDQLLRWHHQFSRFEPDSELSLLNRDPRSVVPASALMIELAAAVRDAAKLTGGLVDATLLAPLERAGYRDPLPDPGRAATPAADAPPRRPASASANADWLRIETDRVAGTITRPPGVMIDSGGLAKGLFADTLAQALAGHRSFAVDCAGDIAIGGAGGQPRTVNVASPFEDSTLHTFELTRGGIATSGIGRRSWRASDGAPAHHLLDPGSGRPAFTGIVQASALAPSALLAEVRAKAALLSGPAGARRWLPDGGVIVLEDGTHRVFERPPVVTLRRANGRVHGAGAPAHAA